MNSVVLITAIISVVGSIALLWFMLTGPKRMGKLMTKYAEKKKLEENSGIKYEYDLTLNDLRKYGLTEMKVEDVFSVKGRGTIVTGKIQNGDLHRGDDAVLLRSDGSRIATKVVGIETFRKALQTAEPGQNVGLLLDGVKKEDVERGDLLIAQ